MVLKGYTTRIFPKAITSQRNCLGELRRSIVGMRGVVSRARKYRGAAMRPPCILNTIKK